VPCEREFEDWQIGGVALRDRVAARWGVVDTPGEWTCLDPQDPLVAVAGLRALLGEAPPDFQDGRIALLTCAIDRDLDCRALSARVVMGTDWVDWADVGWQVAYEPFAPEADEYGPLLGFRFDRRQYETVLRELLSDYQARAARLPPREDVEPPRRRWLRRRRS
jgi:hypothetical protein